MTAKEILAIGYLAVVGVLLVATVVFWVTDIRQYRRGRPGRHSRPKLRELTDLTQTDIDPDWEQIKRTLPGDAGEYIPQDGGPNG